MTVQNTLIQNDKGLNSNREVITPNLLNYKIVYSYNWYLQDNYGNTQTTLISTGAYNFFNCEGIITGTGKVVSSVDNKPLDDVLIIWTTTNDSCFTDSLGSFKVGGFVGCVPECPKLQLLFHKQGYKNQLLRPFWK